MFSEIREDEIFPTNAAGSRKEEAAVVDPLTRRGSEVLVLLVEGHTTKEVAGRLGISFKTAACHRSRILSKFGVSNTVALVRIALRQGLIEP